MRSADCLADWHALHILLPHLERASQKVRSIYSSIMELMLATRSHMS